MVIASLVLGLGTFLAAAPPPPPQKTVPPRISGVVMQTKLVHADPPKYPEAARKKNIQGTVVMDIFIAPDGSVESVKVTNGPKPLRKAASDAVKNWRYKPMTLNGKQIEVETTVSMLFKLTAPPPEKTDKNAKASKASPSAKSPSPN